MANTIWGNYQMETSEAFGRAARKNRGWNSGTKTHRLRVEKIVGLVDPNIKPKPGTLGDQFVKSGKPVVFSCYPICGCTQGQHAGSPIDSLTEADLTCTKCKSVRA